MATLALAIGGAALGGQIGGSILWGTVTAAAAGQAIGGMAGSIIDQMLLSKLAGPTRVRAPALRLGAATLAAEGQALPRVWGRARPQAQLWWSSKYRIVRSVEKSKVGGKGIGSQTVKTETKRVFVSVMLALCEGEIDGIGDLYADGEKLDKANLDLRVYLGTEDQPQDPTIAALDADPPAFRGVAYLVITDLEVTGRATLPQIAAEVRRGPRHAAARLPAPWSAGALATAETDVAPPPALDLESKVRNLCLIPTTGKWALHPQPITRRNGEGGAAAVNTFSGQAIADATAALDAIQQTYPNLTGVTLLVSWFATDLRAGEARVRPMTESRDDVEASLSGGDSGGADKAGSVAVDGPFAGPVADASAWTGAGLGAAAPAVPETPAQNRWRVSGLTLDDVDLVSTVDGEPAYGATPSDRSVWALIRELKARGLTVTLLPFLLMDVAQDNALPDPWGGAAQAAYPWRGRIRPMTDQDAAAAAEVAAFMGTAAPGQFGAWDGRTIPFSGSGDGWRRCVLHYAKLAQAAGGVDAFVIGSEFRALEQVRDGAGGYPFVAALRTLAGDVKDMLPAAAVGYAADWSSYANHRPGPADVFFHLDPLWADPAIDFVGIDNYLPLADWRDGRDHLDFDPAGPTTVYDLDYLRANVEGGEYYDWFYASDADRAAQIRTPLVDGLAGEHFVFGVKRIRDWWASAHHDRPGGARAATPTAWTPKMKPIRFIEIGCPAVDKGANQPNVFVDPKSSESFLPHFSTGAPDADMQRRAVLAALTHWEGTNEPGFLELDWCAVYCEDLRPWPAFPLRREQWGDFANWRLGHWLSGRAGGVPLGLVLAELAASVNLSLDWRDCHGVVSGYALEERAAPRGPMEQLANLYGVDLFESHGRLVARSRAAAPVIDLEPAELAVAAGPARRVTRAQETELPREVTLNHYAHGDGYRPVATTVRRRLGASAAEETLSAPVALERETAAALLDTALAERWIGRDRLACRLPPFLIGARPGDLIRFTDDGSFWRVTEIALSWGRSCEAVRADPELRARAGVSRADAEARPAGAAPLVVAPVVRRMDLPLLSAEAVAHAPYFAAWAAPWPAAGVRLWRSLDGAAWEADALIAAPSVMGVLAEPLAAGEASVLDRDGAFAVRLYGGALESVTEAQFWAGANAFALLADTGEWEIVQARDAAAEGGGVWRLSTLRRGRGGTAASAAAAGRSVVLLSAEGLAQPTYPASLRGAAFQWRYAPEGLALDAPEAVAFDAAFEGVGLRPWPVAQPFAARTDAGDVLLSWRRRSRLGGGMWGGEPAAGFDRLRFRVRVWVGGAVARTWTTTAEAVTYAAADAAADHGARPSAVDWDVAQLDDAGKPGPARRQVQEI